MDWKTLLGKDYTEDMTEDQAQAKFDELYIPRADHDKEIAKQKGIADSFSAQIAEAKRKQREQMTEDEKKEAERKEQWDAMVAERDAAQKELQIYKLTSQYVERGFDKELAEETAKAMFEHDNATVLSNERIFAAKREAALRSAWEQEYHVNPPAGNGAGKVDYSKQMAEAQERGDYVAYASLVRQQAEANAKQNGQ